MKMMLYIALLLLLGCRKSIEHQSDHDTGNPFLLPCVEVLPDSLINWKTNLRDDTARGIANSLQISDGRLYAFVTEEYGRFVSFDLNNGKPFWVSSGNNGQAFPSDNYSIFFYEGEMIVLTNRFIQKFDLKDGRENTRIMPPIAYGEKPWYFGFRGTAVGESIFTGHTRDQFTDSLSFLLKVNTKSKSIEKVATLARKDMFGYQGGNEPIAIFENTQRKTFGIFKQRTVLAAGNINTSRCFLYSVELETGSIAWRIDSLDFDGSAHPPLIEGNRVFVQGFGTIYCVNADDGSIIWKAWCGDYLAGGSNMVSYKNKLALVTSGGRFICVDKQTGAYIYNRMDRKGGWENFDITSPGNACLLNGVMYVYGSGYLYGINLDYGNIVMKYKTPTSCKKSSAVFSYGGLAVDSATNQIFVEDQYFLMAIKAVQ